MVDQLVSTDLIIKLPAKMTPEYFTNEDEIEKLIASVKSVVDAHVADLSTATGRAATKSVAYQVSQTKAEIVRQGKKLTEGWRVQTKQVNAACNTFEERLDALRDQVRKPVTDWENQEQARVDSHKARLESLIGYSKVGFGLPSTDLRAKLAEVEAIALGPGEWQEFSPQASVAHQDAIESLTRHLGIAEKQEREAVELEQLRAEKAERDRVEAERREAEEKEEQRRDYAKRLITHIKQCGLGMIDGKSYPYPILFRELEEKIVIDDYVADFGGEIEEARQLALQSLRAGQKADNERAERLRLEETAKAAEEAAARVERENAARVAAAEQAAKDAADKAARDAKEAQERAEREIAEAKAEAARESARAEAWRVQKEQEIAERAEAERQEAIAAKEAEEAEQRRRDADKAHRKMVNNSIVAELVECASITEDQAKKIVVHLASGLVPNVTLRY